MTGCTFSMLARPQIVAPGVVLWGADDFGGVAVGAQPSPCGMAQVVVGGRLPVFDFTDEYGFHPVGAAGVFAGNGNIEGTGVRASGMSRSRISFRAWSEKPVPTGPA